MGDPSKKRNSVKNNKRLKGKDDSQNDYDSEESESENRAHTEQGENDSQKSGSRSDKGKGIDNEGESRKSTGQGRVKTKNGSKSDEEFEEDENDDKSTAGDGTPNNKKNHTKKNGNNDGKSKDANETKGREKDRSQDTDSMTDSDGPVATAEQGFDRADIKLSPEMRQKLKAMRDRKDMIGNEEESASEPSRAIEQGVKIAMEDVDYEIDLLTQKTKGINDERRTAKCIGDPETADKFTEALKAVVSNDKVQKALNDAGLSIGSFGVRVLAGLGGLALVGVGSFVAIVSQGSESTTIASSVSKQVIRDAELAKGKSNEKFDEKALKEGNAQELMKLMGTNEAEVGSSGTMSQGALETYKEYKSMVAFLKTQKQESDASQP
ncbi:hypothetical protein FMUND_12216 [Fusarium mundagurra]|uniref:Uncharacterized protein n=1 Tax=Fusarium mundagurra TaxID=1567541 RepID=A0A8H5Y5C1_9HYPO|nr:hypothetical protein FMUND_12216 [Fusarium mundagurra]